MMMMLRYNIERRPGVCGGGGGEGEEEDEGRQQHPGDWARCGGAEAFMWPLCDPANQEVGARVGCHQGECCSPPPLIGVNLSSPIVQNIWSESCSQFVFTLLTHLHFVKTHSKSDVKFL